jgi:hypothetical protein
LSTAPGYFMYKTDFKAGYHHLLIPPDCWRFFAFSWLGVDYVYKVAVFGHAAVPRMFSMLTWAAFRPLRAVGALKVVLLDDMGGAAASAAAAKYEIMTEVLLLSALGFTLSSSKCQLAPTRSLELLGFKLNAAAAVTTVPGDKMQHCLQIIDAALQTDVASMPPRMLSQLTGMLLALKPAVVMAPLYMRFLYRVLSAAQNGQQTAEWSRSAAADLQWWRHALPTLPGRPWVEPAPALTVWGDASAFAGGAYFIQPETGLHQKIAMVSWTPEQQQASSTHREAWQMKAAVLAMLTHYTQLVQRSGILYVGDNAGAIIDAQKMGGAVGIFEPVRDMHLAAMRAQVRLSFQWSSRAKLPMELADALSREEDPGQFFLEGYEFRAICRAPGWGFPTLDVMAGPGADEHVVSKYYTQYPAAGSAAADAFLHSWHLAHPRTGHSLAWVWPPFGMEAAVLATLLSQKVSCLDMCCCSISPFWWCSETHQSGACSFQVEAT